MNTTITEPRQQTEARLLVVEDEPNILELLSASLRYAGFEVITAAAGDGVSVVLSSHVLAELERVADYLVLLSRGRVQVAGEVGDLLATHRILTGPAAEAGGYAQRPVVHLRRAGSQARLLVRASADDPVPPGWGAHPVGLEELAMAYLREPLAAAPPAAPGTGDAEPTEVAK